MQYAEKIYYKYGLFNTLESEFFCFKNVAPPEMIKKVKNIFENAKFFLLKKDFFTQLSKYICVTGDLCSNIDSFSRRSFLKLKFIKYFYETLCHR